MKKRVLWMAAAAVLMVALTACTGEDTDVAEKPVIYLYPEREQEVTVKLDYNGRFTCTYPEYGNGWQVTAYPDGRLVNKADGQEYSYLFWEGQDETEYDLSKGYVVAGSDTEAFLREKLAALGLIPEEYNEFIVYWLPRMMNHPYNLITFQDDAYKDTARLRISPEPDSILRVFMVYRPLDKKVEVEEPVLKPFQRDGFTVVEWGGREVRD